ncbi:NADPh quinone reductase [Quaeritorhiza haematococci]|nr:NADPh quinone reductase [Quaeritorhiza haematococci]
MNGLVISGYGAPSTSVINYTTLPVPTLSSPTLPRSARTSLLIRVHAASINPADPKLAQGLVKVAISLKFPTVLGSDYAGVVVAKGEDVGEEWKVGDEVYGMLDLTKGCQGAHAEYILADLKTSWVAKKPPHVSFTQAASVACAGKTAHQAIQLAGISLTDASINKPLKVLIIGASGGVGAFAVLFAKLLGVGEVWGSSSARNLSWIKNDLGCDHVVDYTAEGGLLSQLKDKKGYFDAIIHCAGAETEYLHRVAPHVLKRSSPFVAVVGPFSQDKPITIVGILGVLCTVVGRWAKSLWPGAMKYKLVADLSAVGPGAKFLEERLEKGELRDVVTETMPLKEGLKAYEVSESGRARGKIVITMV